MISDEAIRAALVSFGAGQHASGTIIDHRMRAALLAALPLIEARIRADERAFTGTFVCDKLQMLMPSTAADPNESDYHKGFFDGVMAYGRVIADAAAAIRARKE